MHSILIPNKKGLKLAADIEIPDKTKRSPFVILLHGFKGSKDEKTYTQLAKELKKSNVGSIRFDTAGLGKSEGTLDEDYRFTNYASDVEVVYEYLLSQPFVDKSKIGVAGQSMGAMQTVVFASKHPEIKAAVSISPPQQMGTVDALADNLSKWKREGYLHISSSMHGVVKMPYAFIKDAMSWNMTKYTPKISCPLLVMLGEKNTIVLPEQTQAVFNAATDPKELVALPDMDHTYKNNSKILKQVNGIVADFFEKHLV